VVYKGIHLIEDLTRPTAALNAIRDMLIIKCLRPDRLLQATATFVQTVFQVDLAAESAYALGAMVNDEVAPATPLALVSVPDTMPVTVWTTSSETLVPGVLQWPWVRRKASLRLTKQSRWQRGRVLGCCSRTFTWRHVARTTGEETADPQPAP
jgi:hypothetical protein